MLKNAARIRWCSLRLLPATLFLLATLGTIWAWRARPAAVVDGEVLRLADVDRRVALFSVLYGHRTADLDRREARRRFTEMMIDEMLVMREAGRRGIAPTPAQVEEGYRALLQTLQVGGDKAGYRRRLREAGVSEADVREFARRQETANLLIGRVTANVRVLDKDVAEYYKAHLDEFRRPEIGKFRVIRVAGADAGKRVLADLERGREFAALARERSLDPETRARGGDLGWVVRGDGRLEPALEEAAFALRPGRVSGVVRGGPGRWYVVRMEEYRPPHQFELAEVRMSLQTDLVRQKKEETFQTFLEQLRKKARIRRSAG